MSLQASSCGGEQLISGGLYIPVHPWGGERVVTVCLGYPQVGGTFPSRRIMGSFLLPAHLQISREVPPHHQNH